MALTVAQVMTLPGMRMRLLSGRAGLTHVVRWAHVSELTDPVPWLRGGELVMTIGLGLPADAEGRRAYVERLSGAGCAGLAFALGESMAAVPEEVLSAADACGLAVLEILTPFIAVAEAVAAWHADERVRGERRVVAAQEGLARAALQSGTPGILRALTEHTGGETLLLDPHGNPGAAAPAGERPWHPRAVDAARNAAGRADDGRSPVRSSGVLDDGIHVVQVQSLGFSGPPTGWLAVRTASPLEWHVRMLTNQAACLLAMELLGVRAGRVKAHAQREALLAAVLDGGLSARQLGELCPVAAPPYEVVAARPGVTIEAAIEALGEVVADPDAEELVFVCPRPGTTLFVLREDGRRRGGDLCGRLGVSGGGCRALTLDELPSAARHATALSASADGYTHVDDLEPWALLRDAFDPDAGRRFSAAVLRPLREHEDRHGGHLVASVRAFLESGENVETAARQLGVHRNTLRRRLAAAERVSGRSLTDPAHRLQLWLAVSLTDLVPPGRVPPAGDRTSE
ncbi:PucR family transcriptional regulator [Nonomuraea sp. K274]|uniref:PucR family transcriptional regulator n=1 Tax=Nonomuraea cypriaca TaxID=1187855 RepID=A0A931APB8_9ACTN|nr:PucR family transcriptional regulator [Nonomuraea cypriaca]MBF8192542.1 PucR family transcriptional regulator [Nonomuraea cypriaca]